MVGWMDGCAIWRNEREGVVCASEPSTLVWNERLSDIDDNGLCIYGDWPVMTMRRRLSIPLNDAFGRAGTKGKG